VAAIADSARWLAGRSRAPQRVRPARDALFVTPGEDVLLALPGVGDGLCSAALQYTSGNTALAIVALTGDDPIRGVGPTTRTEIRTALGLLPTEQMAVIRRERADSEPEYIDSVTIPF